MSKISRTIKGSVNAGDSLLKLCKEILEKYDSGKRAAAFIDFKKVQQAYPTSTQVKFLHAVLLYKDGKLNQAYAEIRLVIEKTPNSSVRLNLLGLVERGLEKFELATKSYLKAIEINPRFADPYNNLGILYRYTGKSELAVQFFKKALVEKPDYFTALYNLSCVKNYILNNSEINITLKLFKTASNYGDKSRCCFALYNAYSKLKDYKNAYKYLDYGNKLIFKSLNVKDSLPKYVNAIVELYDQDYLNNFDVLPPYPETPVFIVGMPRSGSSLLEQMLVSHPDIQGVGENQNMIEVMSNFNRNFEVDVDGTFKALSQIKKSELQKIAQRYRQSLKISLKYGGVYTDKTLANYKCVGFIKLLFPNAKFIHIKRNPADVCFACYEKKFTNGHYYSYDLKRLANHFFQCNSLMSHWKSLFPDDIYDLEYEELVIDSEGQIKSCLKFIGLEMNAACLDFHNNRRDVITASTEQVREKISSKSVGKWRRYEVQLQPLLEELRASGVDVPD